MAVGHRATASVAWSSADDGFTSFDVAWLLSAGKEYFTLSISLWKYDEG